MVLVGGVDIPLIELIFTIGIILIIILIEVIVVLILLTYHMRNSRKLGEEIGKIVGALGSLNKDEFKELNRIKELEKRAVLKSKPPQGKKVKK